MGIDGGIGKGAEAASSGLDKHCSAAVVWLRRNPVATYGEFCTFLRNMHASFPSNQINTNIGQGSECPKVVLTTLLDAGLPLTVEQPLSMLGALDTLCLTNVESLQVQEIETQAKGLAYANWHIGGQLVAEMEWPYEKLSVDPWVDSTQRWAQHVMATTPSAALFRPMAFLTEYQSQGRGRRQRPWLARIGQCLMMTVAVRVPRQALDQRLSPAFAVLLCDWLNQRYQLPARVKWPNDLLFDGCKLAGFLVQSVAAPVDPPMTGLLASPLHGEQEDLILLMGLGLNLTLHNSDQAMIGQAALGLRDTGFQLPSNAAIAAEVLMVFAQLCQILQRQDWSFLPALWAKYDAYAQQPVCLTREGAQTIEGINRGIDDLGQLVLETQGQLQTFCIGEVSLRRQRF